jgi:REP element-mobilizing transposase RayT
MNKSFGKRRSIRLKDYDYRSGGFYFITICTEKRKLLFGKIVDGEMQLNMAGKIAQKCWTEIPAHYPSVKLDMFVIMPNHIHGILIIEENIEDIKVKNMARAQDIAPLRGMRSRKVMSGSVGAIVRGYKIGVSKWFLNNTFIKDVWQRNYYEHIIRKEESLLKIQEYILNNPASWEKDSLFLRED